MYCLDVVEVLQMSENQAMVSMLCLLKGWASQAVSNLKSKF